MDKKQEELEVLDFEMDSPVTDETIEMLDFEADIKVSNEIDEMLDFIDISPNETKKEENIELNKLLEETNNNENKVEIDASKEKLDEYVPSIKDFNIKSAKTRKIVKKAMLYVIIIMLLGFEFFINKTGDVLNDLRVYASDNSPIRIIENDKYGYLDYTGRRIVNPKYSYGENFVKGYAIVKDSSNLPLIIDKGGNEVKPTGTYFSLYRAGYDIIASKVTKKGLKYGILDANLNKKVDFKYDMISYVDGAYTYTLDNKVGLINLDGKIVFSYKLTDKDDKSIYVLPSNVTDDENDRYAVVTINSSSQIINLNDGTVVTTLTLDVITPEENNIFYKTDSNGNKTYFYVYDNKVIMESIDYTSVSVNSINTGVIKALTKNFNYQYISVKTKEQIHKNLTEKNTYYGENIFTYSKRDYRKNKDIIVMVKNGEEFKTLEADFKIEKSFLNGIAIVKFNDGTYGYLNEEGNLITKERFIEVNEFDTYGEAIAKTKNGYGVINRNGKVIIDFENEDIKMTSGEVKLKTSADKNVFYAVKKDNRYALYKSNGKKANNKYYDEVIFDNKYPILKVSTDAYDSIITSESLSEIILTSFNTEYEASNSCIIINNKYYNYNGKLIYEKNI